MRISTIGWSGGTMILVALLLIAGAGRTAIGETHGEQTIRGEVFAESYAGNGDPSSASILDDSWGVVMVSPAGKGREILTRIGSVVEATGVIEDSEEGDYVITVKSYTVVQEAPGDDDTDPDGDE